jgi:hypothetical protein
MESHWNKCSELAEIPGSPFEIKVLARPMDEQSHKPPHCTETDITDGGGYWVKVNSTECHTRNRGSRGSAMYVLRCEEPIRLVQTGANNSTYPPEGPVQCRIPLAALSL